MSIRKLIVTSLGTGYLPAPGTWGSALACIIYLAVAYGFQAAPCRAFPYDFPPLALNLAMLLLLILSSVACVVLGPFTEKAFGEKDPGPCNIDEVAGQSLALLLLPMASGWTLLLVVGIAFVAFRFFDILKPPPVRQMEKIPLGWGVLLDDIVAGVYALIVTQIAVRLFLPA